MKKTAANASHARGSFDVNSNLPFLFLLITHGAILHVAMPMPSSTLAVVRVPTSYNYHLVSQGFTTLELPPDLLGRVPELDCR
jgi:hypothetical protein